MQSEIGSVPATVFHYTAADSLIKILDSCQLWVTDIEFLNDEQEMRYGVELVREAAATRREEVRLANPDDPSTHSEWARLQSLVQELDTRFPAQGGFQNVWERRPYVASFCGDGDLLSMWRSYAHGTGFAIEFDTQIILDALRPEPSFYDLTGSELAKLKETNFAIDASFESIEYGDAGLRDVVDYLIEGTAVAVPALWPGAHPIDRIMPQLARTKHPAFAEEKEVRLLVFATGDFSPRPRIRAANGQLVPYFPVSFPHEAIRSIRVGPSPLRDRSRVALERRFSTSARGEFGHVRLDVSKAPLLY